MTASDPNSLLARGGGNATSSGVLFQSGVASYFGAAMLTEKILDRFSDLTGAMPVIVRMETEAPVDDILVETNAGGFVFVQAKTRVEFTTGPASAFAKTVEQLFVNGSSAPLVPVIGNGTGHSIKRATD